MKRKVDLLFRTRALLARAVGKGNIRTNLATAHNIKALEEALTAEREMCSTDEDIKVFFTHSRTAPEDAPEADKEKYEAGRKKYDEVMSHEVEFKPYKYGAAWMTNDFVQPNMDEKTQEEMRKLNDDFARFLATFDALDEG